MKSKAKFLYFHSGKKHLKISYGKQRAFCLGLDVSIVFHIRLSNECLIVYAAVLHEGPDGTSLTIMLKLVKVQFRGPKLYKKGALFQEESYLPRIFRSSSLNLHTFHLIHIVFWWKNFLRKHGKLIPTISKTAMFWSSTLWSWRHNAGARELSANLTLQCMTTTCR